QIERFVDWIWSDTGIERDAWKKTADGLRKRWDAEKNEADKHQLAQPLVRILTWLGPEEGLPFLRVQWKQGPEAHRVEYVNQLFSSLLSQAWTAELEDEAFTLLDKLAEPEATDRIGVLYHSWVAALHRLTDAMLEARY